MLLSRHNHGLFQVQNHVFLNHFKTSHHHFVQLGDSSPAAHLVCFAKILCVVSEAHPFLLFVVRRFAFVSFSNLRPQLASNKLEYTGTHTPQARF